MSMFSSGYPKQVPATAGVTRYSPTSRAQQRRLAFSFKSRGLKPEPQGPPALVPYKPNFEMPAPMEALQDLSMAIGGRRRRSRLSISGIGGM